MLADRPSRVHPGPGSDHRRRAAVLVMLRGFSAEKHRGPWADEDGCGDRFICQGLRPAPSRHARLISPRARLPKEQDEKGLNVSAAELRSASRTAAPTWFPAPGSPGRTVAQRSRRSGRNRSDLVGGGARTCPLPARTLLMEEDPRAGSGLPVHLTGQRTFLTWLRTALAWRPGVVVPRSWPGG